MKRGYWIAKIAVLALAAIGLLVYLTMLLWNALVPELFNGPVLSFWQTLGLFALAKIFFGGFHKSHNHNGHWKPYWKTKWNSMSAEERERFKQKMKDKWCYKPENTSEGESGTSTV